MKNEKEKQKKKKKELRKIHHDRIKHQMLVIVSAVQVDHAGQVLSQPQSRPGHQQVSNNDKYTYILLELKRADRDRRARTVFYVIMVRR